MNDASPSGTSSSASWSCDDVLLRSSKRVGSQIGRGEHRARGCPNDEDLRVAALRHRRRAGSLRGALAGQHDEKLGVPGGDALLLL